LLFSSVQNFNLKYSGTRLTTQGTSLHHCHLQHSGLRTHIHNRQTVTLALSSSCILPKYKVFLGLTHFLLPLRVIQIPLSWPPTLILSSQWFNPLRRYKEGIGYILQRSLANWKVHQTLVKFKNTSLELNYFSSKGQITTLQIPVASTIAAP